MGDCSLREDSGILECAESKSAPWFCVSLVFGLRLVKLNMIFPDTMLTLFSWCTIKTEAYGLPCWGIMLSKLSFMPRVLRLVM